MADELKLHKDKERGAQADALMRNDLFKETLKTLEAEFIRSWASTRADEREARENYWRALQILGNMEQLIRVVAANGRLAQREIDMLAQKFRGKAA